MKIIILGTGTSQGVPIIGCDCRVCASTDTKDHRLRTAALISLEEGYNVVIDAGPDFRQQMLRAKINNIHAILLTHEHNDHVIGLDDVRPFNFRWQKDMPIYAEERVLNELRIRFAYAFAPAPYPGIPQFIFNALDIDKPFWVENTPILPIRVWHGKLPIAGFRIGDFVYITDAKSIDEVEINKIKNCKILILNALHHNDHYSHLNLQEALALIKKIEPEQAFLTHISHNMGLAHEINATLPPNVALAFDEQVIVC